MSTDKKTSAPVREETAAVKSVAVLLAQLDGGRIHAEAAEEWRDLLKKLDERAVHTDTKAKGELVIVLKPTVEPSGMVSIDAEIKVKAPKPLRGRSHFWMAPGFGLSHKNPRQQELPLREVPAPKDSAQDLEVESDEARSV